MRTDQAQSCQPLVDDGERLATIARGRNVELRIGLKEFKGHRFIRFQEWSVNAHNSQWWPTRGKGFSVKPREVDAVIAALTGAKGRIDTGAFTHADDAAVAPTRHLRLGSEVRDD